MKTVVTKHLGYSIVRKSTDKKTIIKKAAETLITEVSKTARLFNKLSHAHKKRDYYFDSRSILQNQTICMMPAISEDFDSS